MSRPPPADEERPAATSSSKADRTDELQHRAAGPIVAAASQPSTSSRHHHMSLAEHEKELMSALREDREILKRSWTRFTGKDRWVPWIQSFRNFVLSSHLNLIFVLVPIAWVAHFRHWNPNTVFTLCFLAIIPMEQAFDFLGEQLAYYIGKELGDLLIITMNNAVEATLAIILLLKCELRLLQATIAGVIILHLLLIPGTAFLTGGARIWEQNLHPHPTQLNHSLLTIGVLAILLPTAFFAALDNSAGTGLINNEIHKEFLEMSHGIAVILLIIYIASRIYLHNPPGPSEEQPANHLFHTSPDIMKEVHEEEHRLATEMPQLNVWASLILMAITIGLVAATAEFLVESIEHVRESGKIAEEWFGLILLPLVSYSADGTVALMYFAHSTLRLFFGVPHPPQQLAKGIAIDLSVQFALFWMPFLVLLGWWTSRPLHLLFDYFELALLLAACFLVNYVTADAKTNWVEGLIMVSFYAMIATVAWWYPGQTSVEELLLCHFAEGVTEIPPGELVTRLLHR